MKFNILRFIVFIVVYLVLCWLIDTLLNTSGTLWNDILRGVVMIVLFSLSNWLDKNGYNSWSKVSGLFKKK